MSSAARQAEARRLGDIRARVAALDGAVWQLASEGDGMALYSRNGPDMVRLAAFERIATSDELQMAAGAPQDIRFLLSMLDRCAARVKELMRAHGRDAASPLAESINCVPTATRAGAADNGRTPVGASPSAAADMRQPDHTTEAAMLCSDPAFKRFLMDVHGLESPATDERTAQKLRGLLGITSRKEINQSADVRAGWVRLRDDFRAWKRVR